MTELVARSSEPAEPDAPLAESGGDGWIYLGRAAVHPTGAMALLLGICLGALLGGALGVTMGLIGSIGLMVAAVGSARFRKLLDSHMAARERGRRLLEREHRLRLASPLRRAEFADLCCLVEEIEAGDAARAARLELEALLDHYVELAIAHNRMVEAVQRADRAPLWEAGAARTVVDLAATPTTHHRQDILARRLQHRDECRNRATILADELDAVAEFVQLVSELISCPMLDVDLHREIERRLWELQAQESALRQLDAAA
jgi:hypothetical protein